MMTKMTILTVVPEVLAELLQLPKEATLLDVRVPFGQPGLLELKVSGIGWDTPCGAAIIYAQPAEMTVNPDKTIEIDWKVPKNVD